jgi:hypothetical protein
MSITLASAFAPKTAPQGGGAIATEGVCAGAGASCAGAKHAVGRHRHRQLDGEPHDRATENAIARSGRIGSALVAA